MSAKGVPEKRYQDGPKPAVSVGHLRKGDGNGEGREK